MDLKSEIRNECTKESSKGLDRVIGLIDVFNYTAGQASKAQSSLLIG